MRAPGSTPGGTASTAPPQARARSRRHGAPTGDSATNCRTSGRNSRRGISRAPKVARCSVFIWQSITPKPHRSSCRTRCTSAIFDASVRRANMDSPKKRPPERHAVETTHQLAFHPCLDRVRDARGVQPFVHRDHPTVDPGARLQVTRRCARANDLTELRVRGDAEVIFPQAPGERFGDVQFLRKQHHARVGAPPEDGVALAEPGEDPLGVHLDERTHRQGAAHGKQAVGPAQRAVDRREGVAWAENGNHGDE